MFRIMCKRTFYYIYLPQVPKPLINNKDYYITTTLEHYGNQVIKK
jgi:hypothetical protein